MLEEEIFNKYKVKENTLLDYGFKKEKNKFIFEKKFLNSFLASITIFNNKLEGKVIDLDFNEEYSLFRVKDETSSYANKVKNEYENILLDIRNNCFIEMPFRSWEANEVNTSIKEKYGDDPEFPWSDSNNKDSAVYRDKKTKKWYALIQYVDINKLDSKKSGKTEIINLKIPSSKYKEDGIYPAYHMNHEKWISVVLDGTLTIKRVMDLIEESHENIVGKEVHTWLIPSTAGDSYFNLEDYFSNKYITWNQSTKVHVGDRVYIYVGAPYSCIMYKCKITKINLPGFFHYKYSMELEVLKKYERGKYNFKLLNKYGVKAVRGPRSIPNELVDLIEIKNK